MSVSWFPTAPAFALKQSTAAMGWRGRGGVVMKGPIEFVGTGQGDDTVFQQKRRWCGRKFTLLPLRTHFSRERPGGEMAYLGRDLTKAKAKEHVTFHM